MEQSLFKFIKGKIKKDIVVINTELGYDLYYKLTPEIKVDLSQEENGMPFFSVGFKQEYLKTVPTKKAISLEKTRQKLINASSIPLDLDYDNFHIGFVYSDGDVNNHRWMLNFFDKQNNYLTSLHCDKIKVRCPFDTTSWQDGIWHGRFMVYKSHVSNIIEKENGDIEIVGKLSTICKPLDSKKVCSSQNIPEKTKWLRLRYNIRENIWYCDFLSKTEKEIETVICKKIICDAPFEGKVTSGDKPKVSAIININDVSEVAIALNSLIIRGK